MDDLYDLGRPFAAVPDFIYNVLIKFRFMADEKQGSPVFPKGLFQGILSVCIQVIGRLVQKQDVGIPLGAAPGGPSPARLHSVPAPGSRCAW